MEEIEKCPSLMANSRESYYIEYFKCQSPHGYNKQRFSHSKHTNGMIHFKNVISAEIKGVERDSKLHHVYVYLTKSDHSPRIRLTFGSGDGDFPRAVIEAKNYCLEFLPPERIIEHNSLQTREELWWPYKEKIERFDEYQITKIRINLFLEHLVRIYITTSNMKKWSEQKIITFGGKTVATTEALKIVDSVIQEFQFRHPTAIIVYDERLKQFTS